MRQLERGEIEVPFEAAFIEYDGREVKPSIRDLIQKYDPIGGEHTIGPWIYYGESVRDELHGYGICIFEATEASCSYCHGFFKDGKFIKGQRVYRRINEQNVELSVMEGQCFIPGKFIGSNIETITPQNGNKRQIQINLYF